MQNKIHSMKQFVTHYMYDHLQDLVKHKEYCTTTYVSKAALFYIRDEEIIICPLRRSHFALI